MKQDFRLDGDFIELHKLLKLTGIAGSGGTAKAMIAEGEVAVDGTVERRKRFKVRRGQTVACGGEEIEVA